MSSLKKKKKNLDLWEVICANTPTPQTFPNQTKTYTVISILQCFHYRKETKDRGRAQMFCHILAFWKIFLFWQISFFLETAKFLKRKKLYSSTWKIIFKSLLCFYWWRFRSKFGMGNSTAGLKVNTRDA